jgi:pimeloyl-ACP methyl ester carboxylesterase
MLPVLYEKLGPDLELVAVDMAGHGQSDHKHCTGYALTDYAADALLIADALGWARFTLVGHSLGGLAASVAAGTQPDRIVRLVMLDISGPNGQQADEAPEALAKSVAWVAERSTGAKSGGSRLKVFSTMEEAAKQRAEKNIGGPMTVSNAMLMASRGVVEVKGEQSGLIWASDPNLMLPSAQLTPTAADAFMTRIKCPTLVLVSLDGIYQDLLKRGGRTPILQDRRGLFLTHSFGRLFGSYLALVWIALKIGSRVLATFSPKQAAKLEKLARQVREGWRIGARLRAIRPLRFEQLQNGGHHFHMTVPEEAVNAIARWLKSRD